MRLKHSINKVTKAQDTKGMTAQETHTGPMPDTKGGECLVCIPQSIEAPPGEIRAEPARLLTAAQTIQLME